MLRLEHIGKNGHELQDLSITFRENELVNIVCQSEDIRKTLFHILAGMTSYDQGDLLFNDFSTHFFKKHQWDVYRKCCVGIAHLGNLNHTILETIELGLVFKDLPYHLKKRKAINTLHLVGIKNGLKREVRDLTNVERICLSIAKAIVNDARIILIDENIEILREVEKQRIFRILNEIADDRLVILFSSEDVFDDVDRKVIIEKGKVVLDNYPVSLTAKKKGAFNLSATPFYLTAILEIMQKNAKKHPLLALCFFLVLCLPYFISWTLIFCVIGCSYWILSKQKNELLFLKQIGATYYDLNKLVDLEVIPYLLGTLFIALMFRKKVVLTFILSVVSFIVANAVILYFKIERGAL